MAPAGRGDIEIHGALRDGITSVVLGGGVEIDPVRAAAETH
jgi:hypothetical protein